MNEKNLKMLYELEKCNEEYLLLERENKLLKKNRLTIGTLLSVLQHRIDILKYKKKYKISRMDKSISNTNLDIYMQKKSLEFQGEKKIVVYTCITGNYDDVFEPRYDNKNVKYILFTDKKIDTIKWEIREIPKELKQLSPAMQNRYIKLHPYEFLKDFDFSIYIDGSVEVISDLSGLVNLLSSSNGIAIHRHFARNCVYQEAIMCQVLRKGNKVRIDEQMIRYRSEGFPEKYGLLECAIIVTDVHNKNARDIYCAWWDELLKSLSGRDQLSLPYVLWRKGISPSELGTLGNNIYLNPKFRIHKHNKTGKGM